MVPFSGVGKSPLLCCDEQVGARGPCGVRPVPPFIRDSKFSGMPLDGVLIGMLAMSVRRGAGEGLVLDSDWCLGWDMKGEVLTGREVGRGLLLLPVNTQGNITTD